MVIDIVGYHKIPGPFKRYVDGPLRNQLIPWEWTQPEFGYLQHVPWRFTEKVDGTNVRVVWDGHRPIFMGRTSRAQMPTRLSTVLQTTFTEELLEQVFGATPAILFGEGYGAGIQRGGTYRPDVSFILFDVRIGNMWLEYNNVADIAKELGIDVVPVFSTDTLNHEIREMTQYAYPSHVSIVDPAPKMEGLVGTPIVPLLDRRGGRIIVKLKTEDLYGLALTRFVETVSMDLPMAA